MSLEASPVTHSTLSALPTGPGHHSTRQDGHDHSSLAASGGSRSATGKDAVSIRLNSMGAVLAVSSAPAPRSREATSVLVERLGAGSDDNNVIEIQIGGKNAARSLASLKAGEELGSAGALPRDAIVERLSRALDATKESDQDFAGIYADAVKFAIVARVLSLRSDRDVERQAPRQRVRHELPKWRLKRVVEYVATNLGEPITLAAMASAAGLSKMHFAAQFRLATGMPPHEFVLRRRIEYAQELLSETRTSIIEVALSVGFQTQAHFTTVFKRFVGDTPYRWRCAARARN